MFVVLVEVNSKVTKVIGPFPDSLSANSYVAVAYPIEHYEAVCMGNVKEFAIQAVEMEKPDVVIREN